MAMTDQEKTMVLGSILGFKNINECVKSVFDLGLNQLKAASETDSENRCVKTQNIISLVKKAK